MAVSRCVGKAVLAGRFDADFTLGGSDFIAISRFPAPA